ncbi:MAG: Ig-like domain-containing protein [Candidatus Limnocylindrales bacterium]
MHRFAALMAAAMLIAMLVPSSTAAASPTWSHRDMRICGASAADPAACASVARVLYANGAAYHAKSPADLGRAAKAAASVSYTAVGIRTAYGITAVGDPSRVIAIIDAYDDRNAYSNLSTYRSMMGLPAIGNCSLTTLTGLTSAATTPCFAKVNQTGGTKYPVANSGWANEIDLDLQAASAVCPMCSIVLVEASNASFSNLGTAITTASSIPHVLAISNSYGSSGDVSGASYPAWDNAAKKGLAVMASTGDGGYGASFPASGTYVIAVGGTTLAVDGTTGARTSETAWSGASSGCSSYNPAGSWQVIPGSPCGTKKAMADLSADADPSSGFQVYTTYNGTTGLWIFGGTSLSSPLMGALYAMQGGYDATTLAGQYAWAASTPYYDVTSGSNGTCSPTVLCTAGTGWDGPTGRGSIQLAAVSQTLKSIAVTPSSASIAVGATQQFTATALDENGLPMVVQPTFTWTATGGSVDATGLFTAPTSTGSFTVTATSGTVVGSASVTVTAPVADFSLSVSPTSQSVKRGASAIYTVSVGTINGFADPVSLSLTGAPTVATVTWSANPTTPGTVTLTIKTASNTRQGNYSLTIKGVSGTLSHTASATLKVTK